MLIGQCVVVLHIHKVVVQTEGDILVEEVGKPRAEVTHATSFRKINTWQTGSNGCLVLGVGITVVEVEETIAEHEFQIVVVGVVNTGAGIVVLVIARIDNDTTCRNIETVGVVAVTAFASNV